MIDVNKKYKTRDGREVIGIFICPDPKSCDMGEEVGGWIKNSGGKLIGWSWGLNGSNSTIRHNFDLVEAESQDERWASIYQEYEDTEMKDGEFFLEFLQKNYKTPEKL